MKFLTSDDVNQRSLEMFAIVNKIEDSEIKANATEFCQQRIEEMREHAALLEDYEFWSAVVDCLEEYMTDDTLKEQIQLLKRMVEDV